MTRTLIPILCIGLLALTFDAYVVTRAYAFQRGGGRHTGPSTRRRRPFRHNGSTCRIKGFSDAAVTSVDPVATLTPETAR